MPKRKPNKEAIINQLVIQAEQGMERRDLLADNVKKWQISERTFDRYWVEALKRVKTRQQEAQKEINELYTQKEIEAFESGLNDKNAHAQGLYNSIKRLEKQIEDLEKVKIGAVKIDGRMVVTTQSDVTQAKNTIIKLYAEIRNIRKQLGEWYGFNAPIKNEHSGDLGFYALLTDDASKK